MQSVHNGKRRSVLSREESAAYRSPLRYPGGKQRAIAQIAKMLPAKPVREYREPFVGGGSVFLHARSTNMAERYWINDLFPELVCFWQSLQNPELCRRLCDDLEELRRSFRDVSAIKDFYMQMRSAEISDEYEKAKLFFFFNRVTFSGTTRAGGFSQAAALRRFTASSIARLRPVTEALTGVQVTCGDFSDVIEKPGNDAFIFLDPPYFTANRLYGPKGSLHEFDHERLAAALKRSSHRFLITYDDCSEIRNLYNWKGVEIVSWQLQYGMNNCNEQNLSKVGTEIFIRNYSDC